MRFLFAPIEARPTSFVIADELENAAFAYLEPDRPGGVPAWQPGWRRGFELPRAVSIFLAPRQDAAGLRPVTITVPIRSTMTP